MVTSQKKSGPKDLGHVGEATLAGVVEFDPWLATMQEAVQAANAAASQSPPQLFQYMVAQEVKEAEARFVQLGGMSGGEVLDLLVSCVRAKLVVPSWLANEFVTRHARVREFRSKSWDEAFGAPFATGTHVETEGRRYEEMRKLGALVMEFVLRNPSKAHSSMWDEWAEACRPTMSGKQAQKLYKQAVELRLAQPIDRLRRAAKSAAENRQDRR